MMKAPLLINPLTVFLVVLMPQLGLAIYGYRIYALLYSQLATEGHQSWTALAAWYAGSLLLTCVISTATLVAKRMKWLLALLGMTTNIALLYFILGHATDLIPPSIAPWMLDERGSFLTTLSCVMPTVLYYLFVVMFELTPPGSQKAWKSFLVTLAIPICCYLIMTLRSSQIDNLPSGGYWSHLYIIACITILILFIFSLFRWLIILSRRPAPIRNIIIRLFFGLIFPLVGLWVNEYAPFIGASSNTGGIFGDFSDPIFPILATLNGVALILPRNTRFFPALWHRAILSFTLPFSLYFLFIFLPYMPIALLGVFFYGAGLLILAPTVNAYLHVTALRELWSGDATKVHSWGISLASFLIIPLLVIGSYSLDRVTLTTALSELRSPDYRTLERRSINTLRLTRILKRIEEIKKERRGDETLEQPFLSELYRFIVLDNLTLSQTTLRELRAIFEIEQSQLQDAQLPELSHDASLSQLSAQTTYSERAGALESTVTVITSTQRSDVDEFRSDFSLPPGAWISDYTLTIENEEVHGQIIEKKVALWVFNQIRGYRRDPGVLSYIGPNTLRLQVFPVSSNTPRTTRFTILHREPFELHMHGKTVLLDYAQETKRLVQDDTIKRAAHAVYLPSALKQKLPKIKRTPYYYFIINCKSSASYPTSEIEKLLSAFDVTFANNEFYEGTRSFRQISGEEAIEAPSPSCPHDGAYDLDFALKVMALRSAQSKSALYPIPVVVTPSLQGVKLPHSFEPFLELVPELKSVIIISAEGTSVRDIQNPINQSALSIKDLHTPSEVLAFPNAQAPERFISSQAAPSLFFDFNASPISEAHSTQWREGLALRSSWYSSIFDPRSFSQEDWRALINKSVTTRILSPVVSYLVVENDAQREAIRRLQERRLAGDKNLDVGELRRMDEPAWLFILLILGMERVITLRGKSAGGSVAR